MNGKFFSLQTNILSRYKSTVTIMTFPTYLLYTLDCIYGVYRGNNALIFTYFAGFFFFVFITCTYYVVHHYDNFWIPDSKAIMNSFKTLVKTYYNKKKFSKEDTSFVWFPLIYKVSQFLHFLTLIGVFVKAHFSRI